MTANKNLKRRVRARAAKTGESYTTALRHFRSTAGGDGKVSAAKAMRLAVAQTTLRDDPRRIDELREAACEVRRLMLRAHDEGAKLAHFPEGATCSPHKLVMSIDGPNTVGPSDWDRFEWTVVRDELANTAELAARLKLWTVLGSVHQLTPPTRPYNSLYVISDQGVVVTRYDERLLSNTKISYMYSPGAAPVTFDVDGFRFGCALGMEAHYPEVFGEYERLDVDCVLFSSTGEGKPGGAQAFATEVQGHAAANSYWVSFSVWCTAKPHRFGRGGFSWREMGCAMPRRRDTGDSRSRSRRRLRRGRRSSANGTPVAAKSKGGPVRPALRSSRSPK
jgi:predicted amidohydrolase